jgi:hypothetical protein
MNFQEHCCIPTCGKVISDDTLRCKQCRKACHLQKDHGVLDNMEKPKSIICTPCIEAIRRDKNQKGRPAAVV